VSLIVCFEDARNKIRALRLSIDSSFTCLNNFDSKKVKGYFDSLKVFKETYYIRALIYAGTINQMGCSIWAVDFVAF